MMQDENHLGKAIVLGLLLTSVGFGTAGATITSGTVDNVGGKIAGAGYINASSNVTINVTSDLDLQQPGGGLCIENGAAGAVVTFNMNNHNLSNENYGTFINLDSNKNNKIKILNANDIYVYRDENNAIETSGTSGELVFQANHDIKVVDPCLEHPPIVLQGNNTVSMIAGHDFIINTPSNSYKAMDGVNLTVTAGNDISITSSGNAAGIYIGGTGTVVNMTATNGKMDILSTGTNSVSVNSDSGALVNLKAAKDITIGGKTLRAIRAIGGTMNLTSDTGKINLSAYNSSSSYGGTNAAIYAAKSGSNNGTVNFFSDTIVDAIKDGTQAVGGSVVFNKATTITAPTVIDLTSGGKVTAMNTASAKKLTGDIKSDGTGSSADVNFLTSDSFLTGATTVSNSGAINLEFGNSAPWNVTGTSSLTNLVNNSTVNMRYTGNSTNETITTANLSGNGTYVMNTDLQASYDSKNVQSNGDKIIITTSSTGNNILELRDVSLDDKIASQGYLLLVEDQSNGSATFSGKDLAHGGIFKYKPVITTANPTDYSGFNASAKNWYLTGFEKTIVVSDNTKATLGLGETRYANYFMDQDTLLKRLGELRTIKGEPEENGIWARYRHGGMDGSGFSGGSSMVQVGYDKKTANKRYTGFAFNHTSSTYDFDGGATGEGSLDALTVYNTWLGDKNHYFDIVGKLGKMRGNSTYEDSLFPEKGNYDSWFCSISGEYGRKNIDKNGWYYEPQAQLTLGRIRGDDYTTGLGTRVNMASITSLISRAGVTFGKEYNMKNSNTNSNIYGKINWLHEFKGDANTSLRDTYGDSYDHKTENSGSWWNAGFGATINVNKNTHMYLDFEKNFGGEVTTNWIGQLGCQWTWK